MVFHTSDTDPCNADYLRDPVMRKICGIRLMVGKCGMDDIIRAWNTGCFRSRRELLVACAEPGDVSAAAEKTGRTLKEFVGDVACRRWNESCHSGMFRLEDVFARHVSASDGLSPYQ